MSKDVAKNSGKAPSVQFYFKDFMADMKEHDPEIVGAWMLILCKIWHDNNRGEITKNISQLAKIMQTTEIKTKEFLNYFSVEKIADVTECNGQVTITNRRSKRDHKLKEQNRLRQERHREKSGKYGDSNAVVTPKKHHPSSSSSSSSSINNINNTYTEAEHFLNFTLQNCKDAAVIIGLTEQQGEDFYHHFNSQGWVKSNGQKITNLQSALVTWRKNQNENFGKQKRQNDNREIKPERREPVLR